jgi:hypothetical protein
VNSLGEQLQVFKYSQSAPIRSSIIHADVSTYQHHRHPLNNVLLLLKRGDAIIKSSNNRALNNEDDAFRKRTKLTATAANPSNPDYNKEESGIRQTTKFSRQQATHSRRSANKLTCRASDEVEQSTLREFSSSYPTPSSYHFQLRRSRRLHHN